MKKRTIVQVAVISLLSVVGFSCNQAARESSPVELIVTNTQSLHQIDLQSGAVGCAQSIGIVDMRVQLLQNQLDPNHLVDNRLNDVKLDRYEVTYVRTDGGHLVPQSYVRSTSQILTAGQTSTTLSDFIVFQVDALNQAPFAALLPQNGGKDPETGRPVVQMDVVLTVFGSTLAGERVQGSTRFALDFCFNCGGCF